MLERLLQAAVITLLLSFLANMSQHKASQSPGSIFRASTAPLLHLPVKLATAKLQ
jgi:hypothetical protein